MSEKIVGFMIYLQYACQIYWSTALVILFELLFHGKCLIAPICGAFTAELERLYNYTATILT
jgi:hypothetical protein